MRFIRNWVIPIFCLLFFATVGVILTGLPGVNMIVTLDGEPVPGGFIPPEQVHSIIAEGKQVGSYLDVYGLHLPGAPLYWTIDFIALMAYIGYRLGAKLKKCPKQLAPEPGLPLLYFRRRWSWKSAPRFAVLHKNAVQGRKSCAAAG
jgi:hypothetical protein